MGVSALAGQWLSNSSDIPARVTESLESALRGLARPERARRLRQGLLLLLALWAVLATARLIWALVPDPEPELSGQQAIVNPVTTGSGGADAAAVDIERLRGWHLFGEASDEDVVPVEAPSEPERTGARDGIEKGARETRLQLVLRGVVASSEDGLGHAIIEHKRVQQVYAVEDELPVSGDVVLAKVMPRQVVLDNGGTYELLTLFEETTLDAQMSEPRQVQRAPARTAPRRGDAVDRREDAQATALAMSYRQRLYQNPQSLSEVVSVSAVRERGELRGYRVAPGRDSEQFAALGFQDGDLVTSVNGVSLDNPTNTMKLYQTMRTASEAVFEVERGGQAVTVSVSLDDGGAAQ